MGNYKETHSYDEAGYIFEKITPNLQAIKKTKNSIQYNRYLSSDALK